MSTFVVFALCVVAASCIFDSIEYTRSEKLLYKVGTGHVNIDASRTKGGGLQALANFAQRVVTLGAKKNATAVHPKAVTDVKTHQAILRLAKLQSQASAEANSTVPASLGANETRPSADDGDEQQFSFADSSNAEGHWETSDWLVWLVSGPIVTASVTMFVYYTYGISWAASIFVVLGVVDVVALYMNI
eukprot:764923-Hanusia_phi.AAC.4